MISLALWTVACLILEGFFSGSEIALVSSDKLRLTQQAARGGWGPRIALNLARRPEWFFSATLLGQNLFIVANSIAVTFFVHQQFGIGYDFLGLLLSPLILIFGEAVPKILFQQSADRWVARTAPGVLLFSVILYPIVWMLSRLTLLLLGGVRGSLVEEKLVTRESLEALLEEAEPSKELAPLFKQSLVKILDFSKLRIREVMTPLVEVFSLRETTSVGEAISLAVEEGYSSIPIYQKRAHNVVGVVHLFDLLFARDLKSPLHQMMEPVIFVPDLMGARELFLLLRDQKKNFAVVVDEYGGAIGIVTLEDILEEIVGEIEDEYDERKVAWTQVTAKQYLFDGRVTIDEINEKLRWALPKENYETLSGFLLARLGRFPQTGEILHYGSLTFLVKAVTARSIEEVLVEIG